VATGLPAAVAAIVGRSGLPAKSFAFEVRPVGPGDAQSLLSFRADQPVQLASTAKLVTSLAALDLLGPQHRWRTVAYSTAPLSEGRLRGDLVIIGGPVGLTGNELRRWFVQLRQEGLLTIFGNIVLDNVTLLHDRDPKQVKATEDELALDTPIDARTYNQGKLVVSVRPTAGERAAVSVKPRPADVLVINDVLMGGGCSAWASWKRPEEIKSGPALQLWVRGRWKADCPGEDIAYVRPPAPLHLQPVPGVAPVPPIPAPRMVAGLFAETGGSLRGTVIERDPAAPRLRNTEALSELATPVGEVLREMNKTSNNEAARSVLLALAPDGAPPAASGPAFDAALRAAQQRGATGCAAGVYGRRITIVVGSGQSRPSAASRGRWSSCCTAWRGAGSQTLLDSLPIAGVDGTHEPHEERRRHRPCLPEDRHVSDTRALAGYVRAKSGKVYAVAMVVTDAQAGRATPALDAVVEWIATAG
jgi:D-alanyl-D-alanine carboxypeptidase/D-alanyl-D-alanine-endopeptidase (penicillin-binding protein 4)